jgi:cytoskeletal protein RodZ
MAPNIPDLPRREQRRGTNQAMMWGVGLAIVLFAAVLVWVFVMPPNGQLGDTTRQRPSPSTGVLANQGAGESQAGKNQTVTPRQSPATGSGQNSSGEAAEIEQSATPLKLTDAQREQVRAYFAGKSADRLQSVDFSIAVGAAVPQQVELQKLPPQISSVIGGYQGDDYLIVGDQLVIVDPSARRVVAIVPNVG